MAAVVDLADQAVRGAMALEEEEARDGGEEEGEMETQKTEEEELSQGAEELGQEVAGEGEEGVIDALTMGVVKREGEEGEEEDSTMTALNQVEETKKVRERERD